MLSITSSRPDLAGMGTTLALQEQTTRVLRSVIGQNRWISAMLKTKVKLNFKLLSSNFLYDGVIRAEALNTYGLVALCVDSARLRVNINPEPEVWHGTGKC